jgi:hypothetical protein
MISLGNIANGFLPTICRISPDKVVPLWMTILISAFSLHIHPPLIPPLTLFPHSSQEGPRFHSIKSSLWLVVTGPHQENLYACYSVCLVTHWYNFLKRAFKSPNPALNVTRRNEPVACDIVYANVPAIDDGSIAAVIFVGTDTQVTDEYGIKTDKGFVNTLENNLTYRGAPNKLKRDSAQLIMLENWY